MKSARSPRLPRRSFTLLLRRPKNLMRSIMYSSFPLHHHSRSLKSSRRLETRSRPTTKNTTLLKPWPMYFSLSSPYPLGIQGHWRGDGEFPYCCSSGSFEGSWRHPTKEHPREFFREGCLDDWTFSWLCSAFRTRKGDSSHSWYLIIV